MKAKKAIALVISVLSALALFAPATQAAGPFFPKATEFFPVANAPREFRPLLTELFLVGRGITNGNVFNDSVLVLHKGELIYERHAGGWDKDKPHQMYSVTKSVLSALVGIAIADGKLKGVDQKVVSILKNITVAPGQESKRDITIEHLLTQTSGLPGDSDDEANAVAWWDAKDSGKAAFELPQMASPGERFAYSSGPGMQCLAALITKAVGENLFSYAKRKLFKPLGMDSVLWDAAADGVNYGGFGFSMSPRDMLRLGYLYLNEGNWNGKQIIPTKYIEASKPKPLLDETYGYAFWNSFDNGRYPDAYHASGSFGNFIFIMPGEDTIIVRTGSAGPATRTVSRGMGSSKIVEAIFMGLVYPLVPLKGVPLEYFIANL